ncbi:hypothetical protein SK128_020093 [Halocaridina rubra]|uniref:Chitin-binding type-2 domain-containing protein n=1 Tax=Halocaridina rubra TaxID=373956 RepID=A0AAN8XEB0_HALRR
MKVVIFTLSVLVVLASARIDYTPNLTCENGSPTEVTPQPPSEITEQCPAVDPPESVYLDNPDQCSSFYECVHGDAIFKCCPPPLLWDSARQVCDWDYNVDCGSRPNSEY